MTTDFSKIPIRALPNVVDELARTDPEKTWVEIPRSNENLQDGYKAVTFAQLSKAVSKMARWIEQSVGTSTSRETLAFMDRANDIRYAFATIAVQKTGHKILLVSTRNSAEGQRALLQRTQCTKFLFGQGMKEEVLALRAPETSFEAYEIPTLDYFLQGDAEFYPGEVSSDPYEVVAVIHTSGSTGIPKPIYLSNGYISVLDRIRHAKLPEGRQSRTQRFMGTERMFINVPWFHAMGFFATLRSIYSPGPLILAPVGRVPNADLALQILHVGKPEHALFPPAILEDLVDTPGGLEAISKLDYLIFGGAPLAKATGDRISKVINLQTIIGATEGNLYDSFAVEDGADWEYFEWIDHTGAVMEPLDDLHELVIKRNNNACQGAFYSFPDLDEWRTKDLYEEHPTKPGLWRYKGRADDVIVLSNGEKFNPVLFEKALEGHHDVKGALVVGQDRFQAGLILELGTPKDPEEFLEEIWPYVEKANEKAAAHGRVWKSKIAIAKPTKPFERAPKGNIMRRATNLLFADEIEALYSNEGSADLLGQLDPKADESSVRDFVRRAIHVALPKVPEDVDDDADIFTFGVDSLQVLAFANTIGHSLPKKEGSRDAAFKPRMVYSNPSVATLVKAISAILHGDKGGAEKPLAQKIDETIKKYTANLPAPVSHNPRQQKHAVVLTGSTGSLGNYLLEGLIADNSVARVYCLNRSDAEARQKRTFEERGSVPDFSKVTFLQASFGKERFGLSEEVYQELQRDVDIFIHNAWAVDFNLGLESFEETHIMGTRRVIDFSATAKYHPHIVFISSIASTGSWTSNGREGPVPEVFMHDNTLPLPQGYGTSKHVASAMLAIASEKSAIPSTVVRVGQLGGPAGEQGLWNRQEWLPSIVASSKAIGKVPRTLGTDDTVDWVPCDLAANVLLDLTRSRLHTQAERKLDTFHLVNPTTTEWKDLVPAVVEFYAAQGTKLEVVEFNDWLAAIKSLPMTPENAEKVPGIKLLDFYDGLALDKGGFPRMATKHTAANSATLRGLSPVDKDLIVNWCKQWKY